MVDGPSAVIIKPAERKNDVLEGSSLGPYSCSADCKPTCLIKWHVNATDGDGRFASSPYSTRNNISISRVERRHSGTYRCTAKVTIDSKELIARNYFTLNVQCEYDSFTVVLILRQNLYNVLNNFIHSTKVLIDTLCIFAGYFIADAFWYCLI